MQVLDTNFLSLVAFIPQLESLERFSHEVRAILSHRDICFRVFTVKNTVSSQTLIFRGRKSFSCVGSALKLFLKSEKTKFPRQWDMIGAFMLFEITLHSLLPNFFGFFPG